jgi:putative ABC transport system substrate-binding protein
VEGQHVHLDYRWPEGERESYPALAAQLVQGRLDVILTIGAGAARAAKRATDTVPIVFCSMGDDPVQLGVVASLARPGGNATGTVILSRELEAKRLELLKEAVPGLSRAAVFWNSSIPLHPRMLEDVEEAARRLHVRVIPVEWKGPGDIEKAFQLARHERVGGVLALPSPETWRAREHIARLALEHRLSTAGSEPGFAAAGNLVQYGPDFSESCRRAAFYVDRILKGAKPADLPVEQPTKFELVINLKTAKALGLTIPPSFLQRADQVIE